VFVVECSLDLDEFVTLFSLNVDESEVEWNVWVLHQHTFHFAWVIILAHLDEVLGKWNVFVGNLLWNGGLSVILVEDVHVHLLLVVLVEVFGASLHES